MEVGQVKRMGRILMVTPGRNISIRCHVIRSPLYETLCNERPMSTFSGPLFQPHLGRTRPIGLSELFLPIIERPQSLTKTAVELTIAASHYTVVVLPTASAQLKTSSVHLMKYSPWRF